jgi:chromosome segregation ATPase
MSVEIHDKLIALLSEVDGFRTKEGELKAEKQRHLDAIALAEGEVARCNGELDDVRENQLRLRREMDALRDELFKREEDEQIVVDEAHVPGDGENPSTESDGKRAWRERQRQLRTVQ